MRKFSFVLGLAGAFCAVANADLRPTGANVAREEAGKAERRPARTVTNLLTGKTLPGNGGQRGLTLVFDNLTNDNGSAALNVSYANCACYTNPACLPFPGGSSTSAYLFPMSSTVGGRYQAPMSAGAGIPFPTDILWDEYAVDETAWGTAGGSIPGTLNVAQIDFVPVIRNTGTLTDNIERDATLIIAFFDFDGATELGGVGLTYTVPPTFSGYFDDTVDVATFGIDMADIGLILYDWVNVPTTPGATDRGLGMMIAGGDVLQISPCLGENMGAGPESSTLWTLGETDPNTWLASDGQTGTGGVGTLPDPCFDGDCDTLSYLDILNTTQLVNWGFVDNVSMITTELTHDFPRRLYAGMGAPPCPGDLDGDGDVDLSDLGIVLADFGCPSPSNPAPCEGDTDGDNDTDLSDLGVVLAGFNQPCP
jgi:hypothetical protein